MNNKLICSLENPSIKKVLNDILDKLDDKPFSQRTNSISILINEKNFKELFEPSEELNDIYLEKDIENIVKHGVFTFSKNTKNYLPLNQRNIKLIFNKEYEKEIRIFYKRLKSENTWENALVKFDFTNELFLVLKSSPIVIESKSHIEILKQFDLWLKSDKKSKSTRQESARCFWGNSKVFDNKYELCNYLGLQEKPILLQVHLKDENFKDILFIENLETFHSCILSKNTIFDNMVLIYSSGYKASAKRVRERIGSKIFFSDNSKLSKKSRENFISWFYEENDNTFNTYFWGDFDYEGMGILSSLQKNFKNLEAWTPAYEKMFNLVNSNFGHSPIMAGKEKQRVLSNQECKYINLLNEKKLFLDQEAIDINSL